MFRFFARKPHELNSFFHVLAVDVNRQALKATEQTCANVAVANAVMAIEGDADCGFCRTQARPLDVSLCNPMSLPLETS